MYLPRNLPLCEPHVFNWVGASGKRYEFAVSRSAASWLDQAAVFVLVRRQGQETKALYVGHAGSLHQRFGYASVSCPEIWRRALAAGMTHVHLRFDACSERERLAEVRDLRAALRPILEDVHGPERERLDRATDEVEAQSRSADHVLVPYRARLKPTRNRDPHVAAEAFEADPRRADLPLGHAFEAPRQQQRADPAREAIEEDAPSEEGGAVLIWGERDDEPGRGDELLLRPAVPPKEQLERESRLSDVPQLEAALKEPRQQPSIADAQLSSADVPVVSDRPPVPAVPSHRIAGIFSRLMCIAVARGKHWLNVVRRRADAKSPTATALPEPECSHGTQTTEQLGPTAPDETGGLPGTSDAPPSGGSLPAGAPVEAIEDAVGVEPGEPATASDGEVEEPSAALMAVKEEPPMAVAATVPPVAEPQVPAAGTRESMEAVKRGCDLEPTAPLVLFAGALSYEAGADIFADALITVCSGDSSAQFMFVGEGPLRGELQERLHGAGLGRRCCFAGDVPADRFERLLEACSFIVIPARVPLGEELARQALMFGKPALVTHQSGIQCIEHGKSGLITYDNPGSFVWGIREILGPLGAKLGGMRAEAA